MADVSFPRRTDADDGPDQDRAQLILITGLTLAVILVAIVLVLNTVIYTENLATRGIDAGGAEAVDFRDGTVDDVAGIMSREHRNENGSGEVIDNFRASAAVYANTTADLGARDGAVTDVDVAVTEEGYFVAQEPRDDGSHRNLTDPDGAANWTVAGNATRSRNVTMTLNATSLSTSDPFTVTTDRPNETWSMSVADAGGGNVTVTVDNGTESVSETFEDPGDGNHTIDATGGTVNGESFAELVWAEGVQNGSDRYDMRFRNGDRARGTYSLVVDDRDGGADLDRPSQPYVVEAVYSADVEVYHRTPELTYGDVVRVAPGERDG